MQTPDTDVPTGDDAVKDEQGDAPVAATDAGDPRNAEALSVFERMQRSDVVAAPSRPEVEVADTNPEGERALPAEVEVPADGAVVVEVGVDAVEDQGSVLTVDVPDAVPFVAAVSGVDVVGSGRPDLVLEASPMIEAETRVRVETIALGDDGALPGAVVAFRVTVLDQAEGADPWAEVALDASGIEHAFGGNYGDRLEFMEFPACALTTPEVPRCVTGTPVNMIDSGEDGHVAGYVPLDDLSRTVPAARGMGVVVAEPGTGSVIAAVSGASGATGTFTATDLRLSGEWSVSEQFGSFSYSLPLSAPPVPVGPEPGLSVNYNSGAVDGRGLSTNNQPSWVGEGWSLETGYVERLYKSCHADGFTTRAAELCWHSPYSDVKQAAYVISFGGVTDELIWDGGNRYRLATDNGWRVTRHTDGNNDDNDNEYFRLTTPDGATYLFGLGRIAETSTATNSVAVVPVYGDDAGEFRCGGTATTDYCMQGYRWMLDLARDANENGIAYVYEQETNRYAVGGTPSKSVSYTSSLWPSEIYYGHAYGEVDAAPARMILVNKERCVEAAYGAYDALGGDAIACPSRTSANASSYPDVPMDLRCTGTCTSAQNTPVFFSTQRLHYVLGSVRNSAGGWNTAVRHQFQYSFPGTLDGGARALWLDTIQTREYRDSTGVSEPFTDYAIDFDGVQLKNRVDYTSSVRYMDKRRVTTINTPLGADIDVTYTESGGRHCPTGGSASSAFTSWYPNVNGKWDTNTYDCFPQIFQPATGSAGFAIFHKYLVKKIDVVDRVGGSPTQSYRYEYVGNPAWGYQNSALFARGSGNQTWNSWRGYGQVKVTTGSGATQSTTHTQYYRGMNSDWLVGGSLKGVSITPLNLPEESWPDHHSRLGMVIASRVLDADDVIRTRDQWEYEGSMRIDGANVHDSVSIRVAAHSHRERVVDAEGAYVKYRETRTETDYDSYGRAITERDLGDIATAADDQCTKTVYAHRIGPNVDGEYVGLAATDGWGRTHYQWQVAKTVAYSGDCASGTVIGRTELLYDGHTDVSTQMPFDGNVTQEKVWLAGSATAVTSATYDDRGRITSAKPPGVTTASTWAYTDPAHGVRSVTFTDATGAAETAWFEPSHLNTIKVKGKDGRFSHFFYDAAGRVTRTYAPEHYGLAAVPDDTVKATNEFTYQSSAGTLSRRSNQPRVRTQSLRTMDANGDGLRSYTVFDGLGRERETWTVAKHDANKRSVVETRYDSAGNVTSVSAPHLNNDPAVWAAEPLSTPLASLPSYTQNVYDWAGRITATRLKAGSTTLHTTTTQYRGDRTVTTGPAAVTETWSDARGRTTKVIDNPGSGQQVTTYAYTVQEATGFSVVTVKDPENKATVFTSDWVGRQTALADPNAGTTSYTYGATGAISEVNSPAGKVAMQYDALGRMTKRTATTSGGTITNRTTWVYDHDTAHSTATIPGMLWRTSHEQLVGSSLVTHTTRVTALDSARRPLSTRVTMPTLASLGEFSGLSFTTAVSYDESGRVKSTTLPSVGNLGAETINYSRSAGHMTAMNSSVAGSIVTAVGRTFDGRVTSRTHANGLKRVIDWHEGWRHITGVAAATTGTGAIAVQADVFGYDSAGRITSINDVVSGVRQCYKYDSVNRLASAWTKTGTCGASPPVGDSSWNVGADLGYLSQWSYSPSGKITSAEHRTPGSTRALTYHHGAATHPHAVTSITGGGTSQAFTYDTAGRMITRPGSSAMQTLAWDVLSNLAKVTEAGMATQYLYDATGQRFATIVDNPTGADNATIYQGAWDATDADTASTGGVTTTRYYTFDGTQVAKRSAGSFTYVLGDIQGSVQVAVTGTTATTPVGSATTTRNAYTPYGDERGGHDIAGDRGWLNQVEDPTGLTYLNARYYDPHTGRFISPDPLLNPTDPRTLDPYRYADNNPIVYTDVSGLSPGCIGKSNTDACWSNYAAVNATDPTTKAAHKTVVQSSKPKFTASQKTSAYKSGNWDLGRRMDIWNSTMPDRAVTLTEAYRYNKVLTAKSAPPVYVPGNVEILVTSIGQAATELVFGDLSRCIGGNTGGCGLAALGVIPGVGKVPKLTKLGGAANSATEGYSNFAKAKTALGSPGPGNVYDHVVEQSQIARSGFTPESIHNPANLNPVSARVNQLKANYYSTKPDWTGGGTVRDWLNGQSFADQHAFGMQVTQDILGGKIGGAG